MPNVLYVGHYREHSGWGQVTRDNIMALHKAGVDVVPRSIDLGLAFAKLPEEITQLEEGDPTKCDVIIQHVLPHYMKYDSHFRKNIGIFELESKNIQHTQWVDHLNIMDELWVPCGDMMGLKGVHTKTIWMPHCCDESEYQAEYPKLDIPQIQNKFVFYFIGSFTRRKHLSALLRAFHTEFDRHEPVSLVIKTTRQGMSSSDLADEVMNLCNGIKSKLNIYNDVNDYIKEIIITVDISRQELLRLHASCDCFVMPSFGEAWCAPLLDAMAMSNLVIASATGGPKDYIVDGTNGFLVDGTMEPIFGENEGVADMGTAREIEFDISISDLQRKMRHVYHMNHAEKMSIKNQAARIATTHSYAQIGNKMKGALNV